MAYTLSNKCAKNLSKRTVLLQLMIKNVVTCFFGTQCIITFTNVKKFVLSILIHYSTYLKPINKCQYIGMPKSFESLKRCFGNLNLLLQISLSHTVQSNRKNSVFTTSIYELPITITYYATSKYCQNI